MVHLTAVARAGLRHAFLTADAGITGGNFLIAETGEIAAPIGRHRADATQLNAD